MTWYESSLNVAHDQQYTEILGDQRGACITHARAEANFKALLRQRYMTDVLACGHNPVGDFRLRTILRLGSTTLHTGTETDGPVDESALNIDVSAIAAVPLLLQVGWQYNGGASWEDEYIVSVMVYKTSDIQRISSWWDNCLEANYGSYKAPFGDLTVIGHLETVTWS